MKLLPSLTGGEFFFSERLTGLKRKIRSVNSRLKIQGRSLCMEGFNLLIVLWTWDS